MSPGPKTEVRARAAELFIQADGKLSNVEIAKRVQAHPLTIGRWKRADQWDSQLEQRQKSEAQKPSSGVIRKKAARDKALHLYLSAGGNIATSQLAMAVGVSAVTLTKWKTTEGWDDRLEPAAEEFAHPDTPETPPAESETGDVPLGELAAVAQIAHIDLKIDKMLRRSHLTAAEVADLSTAKSLILEAARTYLAIVQETEIVTIQG